MFDKNMKFKGRFKLQIKNTQTSEEKTVDWQDNVWLQQFFSSAIYSQSSAPYAYCFFGTGTTTPATTDTDLASPLTSYQYIGTTNGWGSPTITTTRSGDVFTKEIELTFSGAQGAIRGNVTELGLSLLSTRKLFTRALIKDTSGNPTTITLGEFDILTVYYTITVTIDVSNPVLATHTFSFNGSTITATLRYTNYNATGLNAASIFAVGSQTTSFNFARIFGFTNYAYAVTGLPTDYADLNSAEHTILGASITTTSISNTSGTVGDGDSLNTTLLSSGNTSAAGVRTGTWNMLVLGGSSSGTSAINTFADYVITFNPSLVKGASDIFTINSLMLMYGGTPS
ncbi:hypothetical protein [Shewanella sp. Koi 1]